MLKNHGMGDIPASFQQTDPETNLFLNDTCSTLNDEARRLIQAGYDKAEETLMLQQPLLLRMSEYLSNNRCIKKEHINEFVRKYSSQFDSSALIENGDLLFYRDHLNKMVRSLDIKELKQPVKDTELAQNDTMDLMNKRVMK